MTERRLESVCYLTMGQAPDGESYNARGEGLPLIAGAGDFGEVHPVAKKFTTAPGKVCRAGDIVLGIRATIGEKVVADRDYCLGRGVAGLRAKPGLEGRYLWHWLTHVAPILASKARGATFKQVNRDDIGDLAIIVPPMPEQRRIAEVLDQLEVLRVKRRAALAQLDILTQSIFRDMFGDPATNPKGWPRRALESACDTINDCPHSTPTWTDEGVICLRTSNLAKGGWNWDDTRFVSEATYEERSKRGYVAAGDIVLSREGTVGVAAVVQPGMRVCMGQRLVQVRSESEVLNSEYLLRHLLYALDPIRIGQVMVGSTSQHLNVKELRILRIPLPPRELQCDFARRVAVVGTLKAAHRASLAELDALFVSLQHRAFRGEL